MLSTYTIGVLREFYKFAHIIGSSPLEVGEGSSSSSASGSWRLVHAGAESKRGRGYKFWSWHARAGFSVVYTVFITIRTIQEALYADTEAGFLIFSCCGWLCWANVALYNVNTSLNGDEVCLFINRILTLNEKLILQQQVQDGYDYDDDGGNGESDGDGSSAGRRRRGKAKDKAGKIILLLMAMSMLVSAEMFFVTMVMGYDAPMFPSKLFEYTRRSRWHLVPWALLQSIASYYGAGVITFYTVTLYIYLHLVTGALKLAGELHGHGGLRVHRQLQLLGANFDTALKALIMPVFTASIMSIAVSCNYATLEMIDTLGFPAYFLPPSLGSVAVTCALVLYPACFRVRQKSRELLDEWKCRKKGKETLLEVKSFPALGVGIGSLCTVESMKAMAYFDRIMCYTIDLMIAF